MKSGRFLGRLLGVCAALLLISSSAFAQGGDVGSIVGAITDKSGGAISGATVTVTDTERGVTRTLTTGDAGQYSAPNLTPGTYTVKAEYQGFQALVRENILVQVGTQIRVDLSLQPGEQNQTITVTEEVPLVQTTNATLGGALSNALISDLPLNGRNYTRLLDLQPGMYVQPGSGKWGQSSNGMRAEHNVYILDGVDTVEGFSSQSVLNSSPVFGDATSILPIDSIQEFNTEQNPTAEYGWKPGAIVNVGLKSGTNTLHGSADAFGRDSALDATNAFIPVGNPKQQTQIETFGGTIGGPIVKDKLFYFLGYEGQFNHISAPSSSDSLPTAYDLSAITGTTTTTQNTYSLLNACNALAVAPNTLQPQARRPHVWRLAGHMRSDIPLHGHLPNAAVTNGADPVTPIGNDTLNNGLAKIDYHMNDKNTLSGEYFMGNFDGLGFQGAPAQPYWDTRSHARATIIGAHWTWLPSSTVVNEAHFGVNRFFQPSYPGDCSSIGQPSGETGINWGTPTSIIPQTGEPANCGMPPITIQGFTATGCCNSFPKIQGPDYTIQFIDSVAYIHGNHSFKFGGEARHMSTKEGTFSQSRGAITFANGASGLTGLQEYLLGNISTTVLPSELVGTPDVHVSDKGYSLFGQDDIRLTHTFTLNLGVRYERVTPIQESNNQLANFDPNTPSGLIQIGQSSSLYPAWNSFSPRLGFAWDISGNAKWVVRGGFNIIPVLEGFNVFISQQGTSPVTTGLNTTPTGALLNGVPGPGNMETATLTFQPSALNWSLAGPIFPSIAPNQLACNSPTNASPNNNPCPILAVNPNLKRPYAPAWNLSVQHAFTNNLSLQVAYVGSHGVGLLGLNDANAPAIGSGWETYSSGTKTCSPGAGPAGSVSTTCENLSRPYYSKFPYLSNINTIQNLDASNYNGLQVTLTQRPMHGLNYVIGYVYSHCMEMGSGDWNGAALPGDTYNPRADYGDCLTDVRHSLTWSLTYALPGRKGYGQMLEGWNLNSIFKYQTALPYNTPDTKNNISGTGELQDRWNFVGDPNGLQRPKIRWRSLLSAGHLTDKGPDMPGGNAAAL